MHVSRCCHFSHTEAQYGSFLLRYKRYKSRARPDGAASCHSTTHVRVPGTKSDGWRLFKNVRMFCIFKFHWSHHADMGGEEKQVVSYESVISFSLYCSTVANEVNMVDALACLRDFIILRTKPNPPPPVFLLCWVWNRAREVMFGLF